MATRDYLPDQFDLLGRAAPNDTKDAARWQWWQDRGIPGQSMIDRLDFEASMERAGWSYRYGPGFDDAGNPCVVAVFAALPKTATNEDQWEADSIAMHAAQEPLEVLPPLPTGAGTASSGGHFTLRTTPNAPDPRIPRFENSAHSRESRRQANARKITR